MLSDPEIAELRRLLPVARQARRQHSADHPAARASARITEILADAHARGASVRSLSDAIGISYHSVARRVRLATGRNITPADPLTAGAKPPPPPDPDQLALPLDLPSDADTTTANSPLRLPRGLS